MGQSLYGVMGFVRQKRIPHDRQSTELDIPTT
jgi:hypothetical protein